jgi:anti-sigma regulatory factor (Ser/Thr protein kinase)
VLYSDGLSSSTVDTSWASYFDGSPASAREARVFVTRLVGHCGRPDLVEPAAACTAELAANAVLHARGRFHVSVTQTSSGVRIEVADFANDILPTPTPTVGTAADLTAASRTGRGLQIVAALADRWGIERRPESKSVWVELRRGAPHRPTAPVLTGFDARPAAGQVVRLRNMPVRAAVASGVQVDEVVRELQLGLFDRTVTSDDRDRFYRLLDDSSPARLAGRRAALVAAAVGDERFDLEVAVDEEMMRSVRAFRELLEELPAHSSDASTAPSPDVVAYRVWIESEVGAQLAGADPSECPLG